MTDDLYVLDSSVGVKWIKNEAGSAEARELLEAHRDGSITLVVPDLFVIEVLDVTRRVRGRADSEALWEHLSDGGPVVVPTDKAQLTGIVDVSHRLNCSLYDAAAPALAEILGARLVSADTKAHASFPRVRLLG